jgi:hypothetical protein
MMNRRLLATLLTVALMLPVSLAASQPSATPPAQTQTTAGAASNETAPGQRYESRARRRSYQRETRVQRHHRISKKQILVMSMVAGTSMGIGALAGGGTGLAIGAIAGGWGALAVHHWWRHLR